MRMRGHEGDLRGNWWIPKNSKASLPIRRGQSYSDGGFDRAKLSRTMPNRRA
jgi:hypothetical protein